MPRKRTGTTASRPGAGKSVVQVTGRIRVSTTIAEEADVELREMEAAHYRAARQNLTMSMLLDGMIGWLGRLTAKERTAWLSRAHDDYIASEERRKSL